MDKQHMKYIIHRSLYHKCNFISFLLVYFKYQASVCHSYKNRVHLASTSCSTNHGWILTPDWPS